MKASIDEVRSARQLVNDEFAYVTSARSYETGRRSDIRTHAVGAKQKVVRVAGNSTP